MGYQNTLGAAPAKITLVPSHKPTDFTAPLQQPPTPEKPDPITEFMEGELIQGVKTKYAVGVGAFLVGILAVQARRR
jgi:hypothetical protein